MVEEAKVTIFRFDPTVDSTPRYETFTVPPEGWKDLTVLDTIRFIYKKIDSGLSFRESCRCKQLCAACMVMLNKKSVLACDTLSTKEMLIEPVANYPLIKDLVVQFDGKARKKEYGDGLA